MEKEYAQGWNELWNYDTNKITGHNRRLAIWRV